MNKKQIFALRLIGVFVVCLGVFLAVASGYVSRRKAAIQNAGKETSATVISAQHRKGPQNRNSCFIILRYSLEDGNAVTRKAEVPDDVFSRAAEVHEMRIRYDPDDPAEFVFVDFPYSVVERYVVSAVLLVVGLLVAYFAFRARPATP